jgi:spore coat protein CotH
MGKCRKTLLDMTRITKALTASVLSAVLAVTVVGCAASGNGRDNLRSPEDAAAGYAEILSERYDEVFPDDHVQTVRIIMDEVDWRAMQGNVRAKEYYRADIWIDDELVKDVAVRTKGNSSLNFASMSSQFRVGLKVDFNFFNSARSYHGFKKFVYNNGFKDPTLMKEFLGYELMALMGVPAPRACFVDLWVNDTHLGVYTQVEAVDYHFLSERFDETDGNLYKPEVGAGALDWTEADVEAKADSPSRQATAPAAESINVGGGNLAEIIERLGDEAGWIPGWTDLDENDTEQVLMGGAGGPGFPRGLPPPGFPGGFNADYLTAIGLRTNEDRPDYSGLFGLLEVLNSDPDAVSAEDLEKVLHVDEVLRFLAVSVALVHLDNYIGMAHNYYLYEEGGRFWIVPWDLNEVFGGFSAGLDKNRLLNFFIDKPTSAAVDQYPLVHQLIDEPEYLETYRDYLRQVVEGPFSVERMNARIDYVADLIRPYVEKDTHMLFTLEDFEQGLTENLSAQPGGMQPMSSGFFGLKYFVQRRTASILAQLSGALPASKGDGSGNGGLEGVGGFRGGGWPNQPPPQGLPGPPGAPGALPPPGAGPPPTTSEGQ